MSAAFAGRIAARFLREDGRRTATVNERVVMTILSQDGGTSRATLARRTGLAPHSITRLVEPLIGRGLVGEGARQIAGRGKPSAKLSLVADAAFSVGVSVMTDSIALVLMDLAGTVCGRAAAALKGAELPTGIAQIRSLIAESIDAAGLDPSRRVGTGFGVTGYFIGDGARLNPPPQLNEWALVPLDTILAGELGGPVWVDNDGNVAVVGEAMLGAGRRAENIAYLYFAAGFGGGVIAGGAPMRGANGNAGEYASILPTDWPQPTLENLRLFLADGGVVYPDLHTMLHDFDPTDPKIDGWLDICAPSLNLVASAISAALDPDVIVLGGRLPPALAQRIGQRIHLTNPERRGHHRPVPRIQPSEVNEDAAAVGAAMLPFRGAFFD